MVALEKNFEASGFELLEFVAPVEFDGSYSVCTNAMLPVELPKR